VQKIIAVVPTPTSKINVVYLYDKDTANLTLINSATLHLPNTAAFYSENTNQYGQKTIISSNVTEITTKVPQVANGISYINTNYQTISAKPVSVIKSIEYPTAYQISYVYPTTSDNTVSVVVSVDKTTNLVSEVSTYSSTTAITTDQQVAPVQSTYPISINSTKIDTIISYINNSSAIVNANIETAVSAHQTTNVFGNEVITLQALSTDKRKIKVVVNYNPASEEVSIDSFNLIDKPVAKADILTEFKVDTVTGTKLTVTNSSTVLASSDILKAITEQFKLTNPNINDTILTSSASTEYPGKVKVVSIFTDQVSNQSTQVVSIFNKQSETVQIIETQPLTSSVTLPTITREVYTTDQIASAQTIYPSISKTLTLLQQ
jgi:hypothetical protein